jgi:hypothetical protein
MILSGQRLQSINLLRIADLEMFQYMGLFSGEIQDLGTTFLKLKREKLELLKIVGKEIRVGTCLKNCRSYLFILSTCTPYSCL